MATTANSLNLDTIRVSKTEKAVSTPRLDGIFALLAIWFVGGLFLDGWAHNTGKVDSFFTPWHAVLYSGFLVNAGALVWVWSRNITKGYTLRNAIPTGYEASLIGAGIFAAGGAFDMLWHLLLGIEVNLEALISPSHLMLALGIFLIMSGPLRAAWRRADPKTNTILSHWPMLVSLGFTLLILTFFTFPLHPFLYRWASTSFVDPNNQQHEVYIMIGLGSILLQSAILMGCVLFALRRWLLPFGSVTLILLLNTIALAGIKGFTDMQFVSVALITGLLADVLILTLKPSLQNVMGLRFIAFIVPTVLYFLYFISLHLNGGVWWTVPFWSGSAVLAGVVGALLSYVLVPFPVQQPAKS